MQTLIVNLYLLKWREKMRVTVYCISCFLKQLYEVTGLVYKDKEKQLAIFKDCLAKISELPLSKMSPPQVAKIFHSFIKRRSNIYDPYKEIKKRSNLFAKSIMERFREMIKEADDPFEMSLRLAIAGNIIDYGQAKSVDSLVVKESIEESLKAELPKELIRSLYLDIKKADTLLYIGDNAGEIFFDKLFIENFPKHSVIFAVRGAPVINDATVEDALEAGIDKICKLIDTGDETPGVVLEDCSEEFIDAFKNADFVIAKGQGNFETLSEVNFKKIYFLFKIKCLPVSKETGYQLGRTVILCNT